MDYATERGGMYPCIHFTLQQDQSQAQSTTALHSGALHNTNACLYKVLNPCIPPRDTHGLKPTGRQVHTRCGHAAIAAMPMAPGNCLQGQNKDNVVDNYKFAHETGSLHPSPQPWRKAPPRTGKRQPPHDMQCMQTHAIAWRPLKQPYLLFILVGSSHCPLDLTVASEDRML